MKKDEFIEKLESDNLKINTLAVKLVDQIQDSGINQVTIPITVGNMKYIVTVNLLKSVNTSNKQGK